MKAAVEGREALVKRSDVYLHVGDRLCLMRLNFVEPDLPHYQIVLCIVLR